MPHTPGDWDFDEDELTISAQGAPLANVSRSEDFACLPDEDREAYDLMARANGHVMAASNKLLAACEEALRISFTVKPADQPQALIDFEPQLRAAIAAAKGGA
jgi:predicted short-subunit dehydrogenase-like oxidoreductase (DUF2520 family)